MHHFPQRNGLTRLDVLALLCVGVFVFSVGCTGLVAVNETDKVKECTARLMKLGTALTAVEKMHGRYPGYLNVLQRDDGKPYADPESKQPTPVSWAVMILPYIDQVPLYDQYRKTSTQFDPRNTPLNDFICPQEFETTPTEPLTSYVVNTGMPDVLRATISGKDAPVGAPRDWIANGMFFDNFSEHSLIKMSTNERGPMAQMTRNHLRDPKEKTILLTENVDATECVIRSTKHAADNWKAAEVLMGCTWQEGSIDKSTKPPTMTAPSPSMRINADVGKGDGLKFDYCRPSSRHPGGVVICTAGLTASFLNEKISYFVYAKMMASDDEQAAKAGSPKSTGLVDAAFREYPLSDADLNP
jgi:hypothetical protein